MSKVDVSEFQEIAKNNHGVTLVAEQAHELASRHADAGTTPDQSVEDYINVYGLLDQS